MVDKNLQMQLDLVRKHTIYEVVHGSHAYGMNTPTSDKDIKGICLIPDPEIFFGNKTFEQQDGGWTDETGAKQDKVVYSLKKFMELATDCNPNIIEVLFADEKDILTMTEAGRELRANRDIFLSTKARHKFTGYAVSQLKRIQTHKRWIDNPPIEPNIRDFTHEKDFVVGPLGTELPAGAKIKAVRPMTFSDRKRVNSSATWADIIFRKNWSMIDATVYDKSGHESAKKDWDNYVTWKTNRNPARAALEAAHGLDTKHAAHLVRLLRMGYEIITEGKVIVKRPDAQELLAIRGGAWTYQQILDYAAEMEKKIEEAEKDSKLPRTPNHTVIKELQIKLTTKALKTAGVI